MAAKKRKPTKPVAKKAVKKVTSRVAKKTTAVKAKGRSKVAVKKTAIKAVKTVRSAPLSSVDKALTKGQLFNALAGSTGIARKEIATLFDHLSVVIGAHFKKQGPGQFTLPGLVKITLKHKPATKARKGTNPFTGEEMLFKAKPARHVIKVRPLQKLKEMV
jgi:nucleoid DNA-binding protein